MRSPLPRALAAALAVLVVRGALAAPGVDGVAPTLATLVVAPGDGSPARQAAETARRLLLHGVARPLDAPARQALLDGPLGDPPHPGLVASAEAALVEARDAAARFDEPVAREARVRAEIALERALPGPRAAELLAEVHLADGVARAIAGDAAGARGVFALVRALAPTMTALDAARYRPDVVRLFAEAGPAGAPARLELATDPPGGTIWLDGRRAGVAPLTTDLPPGTHYVTATHTAHETRTERIELEPAATFSRQLLLARTPPEEQARALRRALAGDPASPVEAELALTMPAAAAALAELAGAELLVLVRPGPGGAGAEAALYDGRTRRLSRWGPPASVMPLLPSAGRRQVATLEARGEGRAFYRTGWGVATLVGALAVVATVAVWALADGGTTRYCVGTPEGGCAP